MGLSIVPVLPIAAPTLGSTSLASGATGLAFGAPGVVNYRTRIEEELKQGLITYEDAKGALEVYGSKFDLNPEEAVTIESPGRESARLIWIKSIRSLG